MKSPLPADLESAHTEILRLRGQLERQNLMMAKMSEKAQLTKKSLMGELEVLRRDFAALKDGGTVNAIIERFKSSPYGWWQLNAKDGIIAELEAFRRGE